MIPLDDTLAKRNALVLMGAQALGGVNPAIVISLGGLVGLSLAEDKSLATLPVSLLNLGLAAGSIPAAMLMQRAGRAQRLPSPRAYRRRGRLPRGRGRGVCHLRRVLRRDIRRWPLRRLCAELPLRRGRLRL